MWELGCDPWARLVPQAKLSAITVCYLWGGAQQVFWGGEDTEGQEQQEGRACPKYSLDRFMTLSRGSVLSYIVVTQHLTSVYHHARALEREQGSQTDDSTKHKPNACHNCWKKDNAGLGVVKGVGMCRLQEVIIPVIFSDTAHIGGVKCSVSSFRACNGQVVPLREAWDADRIWDLFSQEWGRNCACLTRGKENLEDVSGSFHDLEQPRKE